MSGLGIAALARDLRAAGLPFGVLEARRLQRVLEDGAPSVDELRAVLRCLVVKHADQTRCFESVYARWLERGELALTAPEPQRALFEQLLDRPEPVQRPPSARTAQPDKRERRHGAWLLWAAALAMVAVMLAVMLARVLNPRDGGGAAQPPGQPVEQGPPRAAEPRAPRDADPTPPPAMAPVRVPVLTPGDERAPAPGTAHWLGLALLTLAAGAIAYEVLRRRAEALVLEPPRSAAVPPRPQRVTAPALEEQLLDPDAAREMVWGVDRFVSDEHDQRLDLPRTVDATASRAGAPTLHYQRPRHDRAVWLWLDSALDNPAGPRMVSEVRGRLTGAGLTVRTARFHRVPDLLRWLDDDAVFRPDAVEGQRETAIVAILTDGLGLVRAAEDGRRPDRVPRLLRQLAAWPRLALVCWDHGRDALRAVAPADLPCLAPEELPAFLAGNDLARRPRRTRPELRADPALWQWAAALALPGLPFDRELAWAMRRTLDLGGSPHDVEVIVANAEPAGPRFALPAALRAELLDALGRVGSHIDRGSVTVAPGTGLARALSFWSERLVEEVGDAPLRRALLRLWSEPERAAEDLLVLAESGQRAAIAAELEALTERASRTEQMERNGMICLPWRLEERAPSTRSTLLQLGFGRRLWQRVRPRMPMPYRAAAGAAAVLILGGMLGGLGLLPSLRGEIAPIVLREPAASEVRIVRDSDRRTLVAVGPDVASTLALEPRRARIITLSARAERRPNPTPIEGGGELWYVGRRPSAPRPPNRQWPSRSAAWLVYGRGSEVPEGCRRLARDLLDRGTADLVLIAPAGQDGAWPAAIADRLLAPGIADTQQLLIFAAPDQLVADRGSGSERARHRALVRKPPEEVSLASSGRTPTAVARLWPSASVTGEPLIATTFGLDMIRVPPGVLRRTQGERPDANDALDGAELEAFAVSRFEVTRGDWRAVRDALVRSGQRPVEAKYLDIGTSADERDVLPVADVTWFDAIAFCNALSTIEGLEPCYRVEPAGTRIHSDGEGIQAVRWNRSANGYRLPTEAEWEYVARAGTRTQFSWGDQEAKDYAWFGEGIDGHVHPVGGKKPNRWGLYDTAGNVWEWCWDWWADTPVAAGRDDGDQGEGQRVLRGGSFFSDAELLSPSIRYWRRPEFGGRYDGFRCVRSALPQHGSHH